MTQRPNSGRERTHVHTLGDVGKEDFGTAARFGVCRGKCHAV